MLSFYLSRRSAGSVNEILKEISKETEYYDSHLTVFSHLKSTYSKLVREKSVLSDAIEKQKPFIRSALINRLIYGDYSSPQELKKWMISLGVPWENRELCVLILQFSGGSSEMINQNTSWMDSCVISLLEILEQEMPDSLYINSGESQVILILNEDDMEERAFRKKQSSILEKLRKNFRLILLSTCLCMGDPVSNSFRIFINHIIGRYIRFEKKKNSLKILLYGIAIILILCHFIHQQIWKYV